MPTIGDKLAAIYDTKNKIREAIINKGGSLHEKAALSDYPQAIYDLPVVSAPADTYNYHPNPAWWDIKTIIENDEVPEGYVAVAAFLLVDSPYKTSLDVFDAYKTSDGMFYSSVAEHIWDTTKDKDSGEGYKTRYVIAYVKTDSDRWLGKMLCATKWNNGIHYSVPVGCLGIVWNCPVFISLDAYNSVYLPVSASTNTYYAPLINFYTSNKSSSSSYKYYAMCICNYSWKTVQYINVTSKGKLIIMDCKCAFTRSNDYHLSPALRYIAPLYELAVVYEDLLADGISKLTAQYMSLYLNDTFWSANSTTTDTPQDLKNMNGYRWAANVRNLELHVADTGVCAYTATPTAKYAVKAYIGGLFTCTYSNNSYYYAGTNYPCNGKKLTMVIEKNTIPLDKLNFYSITSWDKSIVLTEYTQRVFVLYPYDNYKANVEDNCTLGIIRWDIVNNSDLTPQVHLFPAYQLNGMPASQLNKFLVDYLQDRTGLELYQMYVTASQSEKLSSTTKSIIAQRNWTLIVFA